MNTATTVVTETVSPALPWAGLATQVARKIAKEHGGYRGVLRYPGHSQNGKTVWRLPEEVAYASVMSVSVRDLLRTVNEDSSAVCRVCGGIVPTFTLPPQNPPLLFDQEEKAICFHCADHGDLLRLAGGRPVLVSPSVAEGSRKVLAAQGWRRSSLRQYGLMTSLPIVDWHLYMEHRDISYIFVGDYDWSMLSYWTSVWYLDPQPDRDIGPDMKEIASLNAEQRHPIMEVMYKLPAYLLLGLYHGKDAGTAMELTNLQSPQVEWVPMNALAAMVARDRFAIESNDAIEVRLEIETAKELSHGKKQVMEAFAASVEGVKDRDLIMDIITMATAGMESREPGPRRPPFVASGVN